MLRRVPAQVEGVYDKFPGMERNTGFQAFPSSARCVSISVLCLGDMATVYTVLLP